MTDELMTNDHVFEGVRFSMNQLQQQTLATLESVTGSLGPVDIMTKALDISLDDLPDYCQTMSQTCDEHLSDTEDTVKDDPSITTDQKVKEEVQDKEEEEVKDNKDKDNDNKVQVKDNEEEAGEKGQVKDNKVQVKDNEEEAGEKGQVKEEEIEEESSSSSEEADNNYDWDQNYVPQIAANELSMAAKVFMDCARHLCKSIDALNLLLELHTERVEKDLLHMRKTIDVLAEPKKKVQQPITAFVANSPSAAKRKDPPATPDSSNSSNSKNSTGNKKSKKR